MPCANQWLTLLSRRQVNDKTMVGFPGLATDVQTL